MKKFKLFLLVSILLLGICTMVGCRVATSMKSYNIDTEKKFELTNVINHIAIDARVSQINFIHTEENQVKLKLYGYIETNNAPKIIITKDSNSVRIRTHEANLSRQITRKNELVLEVYLTPKFKGRLFASGNGGIDIRGYDLIKLKTSTIYGDTRIADLKAERISIDSSTGNIKALNITSICKFDCDTASGELEISNLSAAAVNIVSLTGHTNIENIISNSLDIDSNSGDIKISGQAKILKIDSGLGNINIDEISSIEMKVNTRSGKLHSPRIIAKDIFEYDTTSGELVVDYLETKDFKINTSVGNVTLKNIISANVDICTTSGDVELVGDAGNIKAVSGLGNIKIELRELRGNISINNYSGNIFLDIPEDSNFVLVTDTNSGKISTEGFKLVNIKDRYYKSNGNKEAYEINLTNSTGDILIY